MKPAKTARKPARYQIQATVIRANGTKEELGTIARWDRNIFKRLGWWLKKVFGAK